MPDIRTESFRSGARVISALMLSVSLLGCAAQGGAGFVSMNEPSYMRLTEERAFAQALRKRYLELATNAYDRGDDRRSDFYTLRALMAVEGKLVDPHEWRMERHLRGAFEEEAATARGRLMLALDSGVRMGAPDLAARAQAAFDCWMIESGGEGDAGIARACRYNAYEALEQLEGAARGANAGLAGEASHYGEIGSAGYAAQGHSRTIVLDETIAHQTIQVGGVRVDIQQSAPYAAQGHAVRRVASAAQAVPVRHVVEPVMESRPQTPQYYQHIGVIDGLAEPVAPRYQRRRVLERFHDEPRYEQADYVEAHYAEPGYAGPDYVRAEYVEPRYIAPPQYAEPQYELAEPGYAEPRYAEPVSVPMEYAMMAPAPAALPAMDLGPVALDVAVTPIPAVKPPLPEHSARRIAYEAEQASFDVEAMEVPPLYEEGDLAAAPVDMDPLPVEQGAAHQAAPVYLTEEALYPAEEAAPPSIDVARYEAAELHPADALLAASQNPDRDFAVYFGFDSDEITPEAEDVLIDSIEQVALTGARRVVLAGYTDSMGEARYNQLLAMRRAQAVRRYIQDATGVKLDFRIMPVGEAIAVKDGGDGVQDALGRRVEISVE